MSRLLWSLLWIFSLLSCQKNETVPVAPVLELLNAAEQLAVVVPDTITLQIKATDAQGLYYASLSLVNDQFIRVGPFTERRLNGETTITIELSLAINSEQLNDGKYYVVAQVSNGQTESRKFVPLDLKAIPRRLKAFVLATENGNQIQTYIIQPGKNPIEVPWQGGLAGLGAFSANDQLIGITQQIASSRQMLGPNYNSWQPAQLDLPAFGVLDFHAGQDGLLYVALENGQLLGYGKDLQRAFQYQAPVNEQLVSVERLPDYLLVATREQANLQQFRLYFLHPVFKGVIISRNIDFEPLLVKQIQAQQLLIFGNKQGRGQIYRYYFNTNLLELIAELPQGDRVAAVFENREINVLSYRLFSGEKLFAFYPGQDRLDLVSTVNQAANFYSEVGDWTLAYEKQQQSHQLSLMAGNNVVYQIPVSGRPKAFTALYNR